MSIPVVSIVLPVYNGQRYLSESIASVLAQTDPSLELIIWDDGSSDGSSKIVSSYRDPRIRTFRNEVNQGLFPTLNQAVEQARGVFIRFWAQDDRMKPQCIGREMSFWVRHPGIALTYCQRDEIAENGNVVQLAPHDPTPEVVEPWLSNQISFYHGCMQGNISTVTVRKTILQEVGPFADMRVSGDFDMWTRISRRYRIGFIHESLIELRSHPNQFSRREGEGLYFIRENRRIFENLWRELPRELQRYAQSFQRRQRSVWSVHHMMRLFASGRFRLAREVFREISTEGEIATALLLWAFTANGRFLRPKPRYLQPVRCDKTGTLLLRPWSPG